MKSIPGDPKHDAESRERGEAASSSSASSPTNGASPRDYGEQFQALLQATSGGSGDLLSLREWVDVSEAWYITRALRQCRGNRSAAARALGIGRRTLYAKMEKLGIQPTWSASGVAALQNSTGSADPATSNDARDAAQGLQESPMLRVATGVRG